MRSLKHNRREFITKAVVTGAALPFVNNIYTGSPLPHAVKHPLHLFTKPLDRFDFDFTCDCLNGAGIGGLDVTVRKGGKVEPENVEKDLPVLAAKAKKHNLVLDMMVTGITSASDPLTERVLKTASGEGIRYYRLGWYDYDLNAGIPETLRKNNWELGKIAELNRKYNLHGGYQNHEGEGVGAPVWDLRDLLAGLPEEYIGSQYDVRHATVEGANTWPLGMRLISPWIRTLAIKDFTWKNDKGKPQAVTVPLGEGMVNWDKFFSIIRELKLSVPMTIHIEYDLLTKDEEKLDLLKKQEIIVRKLKKDVTFLQRYQL